MTVKGQTVATLDFSLRGASLGWNGVWLHSAHVDMWHRDTRMWQWFTTISTHEIRGIFFFLRPHANTSRSQVCGRVERETPNSRTKQDFTNMQDHHHVSHHTGRAVRLEVVMASERRKSFCFLLHESRKENTRLHSHLGIYACMTSQRQDEGRHNGDGKMATNHELFERMVDIALSGGHDAAAARQHALRWRLAVSSIDVSG